MNARAATVTPNLRRAPSDQQQPVCPTAFGRRRNPRLCELYRPRDERFARVGDTSTPLPLPSQSRASRSTNRILLGQPMTVFEVHGLERLRHTMQPLPIDLATNYQSRGARLASDFLVRRQAR